MFNFSISFSDLYNTDDLTKLDSAFLDYIKSYNKDLYHALCKARENKSYDSQLVIELSPVVEEFISKLFFIEEEAEALRKKHEDFVMLYKCKRLFIQRYALKKYVKTDDIEINLVSKKLSVFLKFPLQEQDFAQKAIFWFEHKEKYQEEVELAAQYAAWMADNNKNEENVLFSSPEKIDYDKLVPVISKQVDDNEVLRVEEVKRRSGFNLTHNKPTLNKALDNAHYCIYCHKQNKDSCSKGLLAENQDFKKSPLDVELHGCPLEQKISEMNLVKSQGFSISSLAIIVIDNPLCAATGYRICNDCSKSCIYQKQDPVDIPMIETKILEDVLSLPYGFEIYSLLTRWNPLNFERPLPKENTGKNILVVGLGPAGFTLAHHLLNDGHNVVAIDGLKIEPLEEKLLPIKDFKYEKLSERTPAGFGGVAEYGITARWDKNNLKIIRLLLERRKNFAIYGGVRFGGTVTVDDAFKLGFDHIALSLGSGKPKMINIKNMLARGVRMASDFLMSLQLTGALKSDSIANLQIRMPIVVIGGGLTAIDTATESLAYYQVQVEKFLSRYEILVDEDGKEYVEAGWSTEEHEIANEYILHARAIRAEKELAKNENREAKVLELMHSWGGVKIVYRKNLTDSPSYRLNSKEVKNALAEGVDFLENLEPTEIVTDEYNHTQSVAVLDKDRKARHINARTILIAAGTEPNTTVANEDTKHFKLSGKYFSYFDLKGKVGLHTFSPKAKKQDYIFLYRDSGKAISFFGDLHPSYSGSVVKAMASAKNGYPVITQLLKENNDVKIEHANAFFDKIKSAFTAVVVDVKRLTPKVVEVIIKAPMAAANFKPGQFYRLQNFEANSPKIKDTKLAMEGIAATGASVDKEKGLISTIILETGGSTDLCFYLKKNEPVVLMGPTGMPTKIPKNENIMLIGGGVGNAVLFSIGKACLENNCQVLYFAGYKKLSDVFKRESLESSATTLVWTCDEGIIKKGRKGDLSFHGNIIDGIVAYQTGKLSKITINLDSIDRIIVIGSDKMMEAVASAKNTLLRPYSKRGVKVIASVNSPMQCMMKEICAQCLQRHVDPMTGEESFVYSCSNQDQNLDYVDFKFLSERLKQNSLQEKLTAKWVSYCLQRAN
ncbi:FAD-dependent oxidoreductase [Candidatus Mesenet endosymbiont of Phosphuga atrata]|uniref:FAD-dependent oxidoreductase n=1 Tax=Candidatus Mesenet endosymbiont of Phosphuga atrata TaxID=3066221 RepID=UPI0030D0B780